MPAAPQGDDVAVAVPADSSAVRRVVSAQFGDLRALDELLAGIQEPLFRHLAWMLDSEDGAQDVLQDTLLTVSRKLGNLREPRLFAAWAFRIGTRLAIRHSRRRRRELVSLVVEDARDIPLEPPEEPPFDESELAGVRTMLGQVPPSSQLILRMHYESGLTHSEIAEALDLSIGTVKSRHHYGLQWLRQRMKTA